MSPTSGVHDHGFNNVSTYGNLLRLMNEGRIAENAWERRFYELALKCSGAVQAARWSRIAGWRRVHLLVQWSAFAVRGHDPLVARAGSSPPARARADGRERSPDLAAGPSHRARAERRRDIRSITARAAMHTTCAGASRTRASSTRTTAIIRCPNSQQGYSPFSTWTRGLAWAMCGFAEQLEFFATLPDGELKAFGGQRAISLR